MAGVEVFELAPEVVESRIPLLRGHDHDHDYDDDHHVDDGHGLRHGEARCHLEVGHRFGLGVWVRKWESGVGGRDQCGGLLHLHRGILLYLGYGWGGCSLLLVWCCPIRV